MSNNPIEVTWRVQWELAFKASAGLDLGTLIPALHHMIQRQALGEIWIDVVDYRHVGDGPGLLLVTHDAYYGIEHNRRRSALLYRRRRPAVGDFGDLLQAAATRLLAFAETLSSGEMAAFAETRTDAAGLADVTWGTDHWTLTLQDRLVDPSSTEILGRVEGFQALLQGGDGRIEPATADPGAPWTVELRGPRRFSLAEQRRRLTASSAQGQTDPAWTASLAPDGAVVQPQVGAGS